MTLEETNLIKGGRPGNNGAIALEKYSVAKLPGHFEFTEGPVWHPGGYFLFSDTPANCIYRVLPDLSCRVFLQPSGLTTGNRAGLSHQVGSNALAIDPGGFLLICQHGDHAIARLNAAGELTVLTDRYNERPFNSPNDMVVRTDGMVFFSDPPYGLLDEKLQPEKFQPSAGIYRWQKGETTLMYSGFRFPNGLCFAPGEQLLYAGSNHPDEKAILRFNCDAAGHLSPAGVLIGENADGIKTDHAGNLYMATLRGIRVVSPAGETLSLIKLPDTPSNLCWGGETANDLLVTAGSAVYLLRP